MALPRFSTLWPDISDVASAKAATSLGTGAAGFVAVVTATCAAFGWFGMDALEFGDAFVFTLIAIGIHRQSRIAAALGLVLYVATKVVAALHSPPPPGSLVLFSLVAVAFLNGIRGTFAYHRFSGKRAANQGAPATD